MKRKVWGRKNFVSYLVLTALAPQDVQKTRLLQFRIFISLNTRNLDEYLHRYGAKMWRAVSVLVSQIVIYYTSDAEEGCRESVETTDLEEAGIRST